MVHGLDGGNLYTGLATANQKDSKQNRHENLQVARTDFETSPQ